MACDPVYMININSRSHSTLPETLNINAESWATTGTKQQIIRIILLSTVVSASKYVIIYTYNPSMAAFLILHPLCPLLGDPLGLHF